MTVNDGGRQQRAATAAARRGKVCKWRTYIMKAWRGVRGSNRGEGWGERIARINHQAAKREARKAVVYKLLNQWPARRNGDM